MPREAAFDDALRGKLSARLESGATELQVDLTAGQAEALLGYLELLSRWSAVYNLTAVRDPLDMLSLHVLDSLAVVAALRRQTRGGAARLLDAGSGAGLPGLVLAVAMPELAVTCVDAVGKKAAFVKQAAGELGVANLRSVHARLENYAGGPYDIAVSRAFATIEKFIQATRRQVAPDGLWLAMKGAEPRDEIAALPRAIEAFHVEQLAVPGLRVARCLVWARRRAVTLGGGTPSPPC